MGVKVSDFGYRSDRAAQDAGNDAPDNFLNDLSIKERNKALSGGLLLALAPPAPGPYWSLVWAQTLL
jgi:hypothetical protein